MMVDNISFSKFKNGVIYYFSGTGNTLHIINKYVELFSKKNINVNIVDITTQSSVGSQSKYDFICFAYPTYACHPPISVKKFIKKFPKVRNKPCFIICSATEMHADAIGWSVRTLNKKNYSVLGTCKYFMPHNLSFMFKKQSPDDFEIKKILDNTNKKIQTDFSKLIVGNKEVETKKTVIISYLASWFFNTFISKPNNKSWVVDYEKCNQCGLCEKICPNHNITVKHKKKQVKFGDNCLFCSRCYNFCPQKAIEYKSNKSKIDYGRYTKFKNLFLK